MPTGQCIPKIDEQGAIKYATSSNRKIRQRVSRWSILPLESAPWYDAGRCSPMTRSRKRRCVNYELGLGYYSFRFLPVTTRFLVK